MSDSEPDARATPEDHIAGILGAQAGDDADFHRSTAALILRGLAAAGWRLVRDPPAGDRRAGGIRD